MLHLKKNMKRKISGKGGEISESDLAFSTNQILKNYFNNSF